ncbi:MAG: WG repeat-containing protein, partial [Desulfobacterales bacterium]
MLESIHAKCLFLFLLAAILPGIISTGSAESPSCALFPVKVQGKWGYINKDGRLSIQPQFEEALPFSEGLGQVKSGKHWGYIDQNGKIVIACKFEKSAPFSNGLAGIHIENRFGYIEKQGKTVVRPNFASGTAFSNGYAAVQTPSCCGGKWIYLDRQGLMIP